MEWYIATLIQIALAGLMLLGYKKYVYNRYTHSKLHVILGTIIVVILFFVMDAFPYIVLGWATEGLTIWGVRVHHSMLGIFGFLFGGFTYFTHRQKIIKNNFVSDALYEFGGLAIWISILFVISQLHEIIFNGTIIFPERGFPIQIPIYKWLNR